MLDELVETGYTGTELGDWGYMPTDPVRLSEELAKRNHVVMLGAFVPVELKNPLAHAEGTARAVKTARLIAAAATTQAPFLVLADDNGTDPATHQACWTRAGERGSEQGRVEDFCGGADRIARAVFDETGCARCFIITARATWRRRTRLPRCSSMTNPERLGLVFDTGHYVHGTGVEDVDLVAALNRFKERIWYIHLKDLEPSVARRTREEEWDYFTSMRNGLYPELGKGCVDFPALLRWLAARDYKGIHVGGAGYSAGDGHAEGERKRATGSIFARLRRILLKIARSFRLSALSFFMRKRKASFARGLNA
jgi:inosose dehydratase